MMRLLDVTPRSAVNDVSDRGLSDGQFSRERAHPRPLSVRLPDVPDLLVGQHGESRALPSGMRGVMPLPPLRAADLSPLPGGVPVVVGRSPELKMVRVAARRVVAQMHDNHSGRRLSVEKLPDDAVRGLPSAFPFHLSVPSGESTTLPLHTPVVRWGSNARPDVLEGFIGSHAQQYSKSANSGRLHDPRMIRGR